MAKREVIQVVKVKYDSWDEEFHEEVLATFVDDRGELTADRKADGFIEKMEPLKPSGDKDHKGREYPIVKKRRFFVTDAEEPWEG